MATVPFAKQDVPLVGQSLKAHDGFVMASFTCLCKPGNAPQLIRGTDLAVFCFACRKVFRILKVEFDITKGDQVPKVMIGVAGTVDPDGHPPHGQPPRVN